MPFLLAPQRLASLILADTSSRTPAAAQAAWQERIRLVLEQGTAPLVDATLERWFTAPYRAAHPEVMARTAALIANTPAAGYIGCAQALQILANVEQAERFNQLVLEFLGCR